eukprot:Lithocolla_globosa_v1_NODE_726_length_3377_cov_3.806743.p1 type:complete len:495 gc:universal NODE_726_length_3377_cov_3.806743:803-2287(+)
METEKTYFDETKDHDGVHHVYVARRSKLTVEVEIFVPNTVITWSFLTEDHDIGFGVQRLKEENWVVVLETKRRDSHTSNVTGETVESEPCTLKIILDNSFSLTRGKNVFYKFTKKEPVEDGPASELDIFAEQEQNPLNETKEIRSSSLEALNKKISAEKDQSIFHRTDDRYLLRFLRQEHYDVDRSFKKLLAFQIWKSKTFKEPLTAISLRKLTQTNGLVQFILPYKSKRGQPILCILPRLMWKIQPSELYIRNFAAVNEYILESEDDSSLIGLIMVGSFKGFSASNINPKDDPGMMECLQNFPIRMGKGFAFSTNAIIRKLFTAILVMLPHKIRSRMEFFSSTNYFVEKSRLSKVVQSYLSPEMLPLEFPGGQLSDQQVIESQLNFFDWNSQEKILEFSNTTKGLTLGCLLEPLGLGSRVVVEGIEEGEGIAKELGLCKEDVIVSVNGEKVKSIEHATCLLQTTGKVSAVIRRTTTDVFGSPLPSKSLKKKKI